MTMPAGFYVGRRVRIINTTMGGTVFFEGWADVVAWDGCMYQVRFDGSPEVFGRFVDPYMQGSNSSAALYLESLNCADLPE